MEKNETYIAQCEGYTEDGAGVVKIGGFVIFVPGLIEHETAEIGITKLNKNYGYGRVVRIIEPSEHRTEPVCKIARPCGGCQLQHMDDAEQRHFKEEKVRMCFRSNAGMEPEILPILKAEPFEHYRNKVQIPVQLNKGKVEMGFYQNHTNRIVETDTCYVQSQLSNEISAFLKKQFEIYSCASVIRHVLIKHAHRTGQVMVTLIVRNYPFKGCDKLKDALLKKYPQIKSFSAIINRREDNVILDGRDVLIAGNPWIEETLLGCTFRISARSFYQINPYATEILYTKAIEAAGLTGKETLIDLYCGTGTMGIIAASKAKKVYGIEIVPDAVRDAKINAENNHVENIEFLCMDAGKGAQAILRSRIKADAVIVDPPRKGCSRDTIDAIVKISPQRLVYVSCDPATLARDVKILSEQGYKLQSVQPVDMFPHTTHVETVCCLYHQKKDFISVPYEPKGAEYLNQYNRN